MSIASFYHHGVRLVMRVLRLLWSRLRLRPAAATHLTGTATDFVRSKSDLVVENALLRHQLVVLRRSSKRPLLTPADRTLLVLLAGRLQSWRHALLIIQPDTLLRWHRAGFRLFWKHKSQPKPGRPPLPEVTIRLIQEMAAGNPLWGAERIRGELLKLGIHVAKRTIQKYLRGARRPRPRGQTWTTILRTQAKGIWACDFLHYTDLFFRPLFAFFIVEHATRCVVHLGVTRHPTDAWVAQQLREATPYGQKPKFLIRDNDTKFGAAFARVAKASGIKIVRTPVQAPRVPGSCPHRGRAAPAPGAARVYHVLQPGQTASGTPPGDSQAATGCLSRRRVGTDPCGVRPGRPAS